MLGVKNPLQRVNGNADNSKGIRRRIPSTFSRALLESYLLHYLG